MATNILTVNREPDNLLSYSLLECLKIISILGYIKLP
jgi:hypothetical protein